MTNEPDSLIERLFKRIGAYLEGQSVTEDSLDQVCEMFGARADQISALRRRLESAGINVIPADLTEPEKPSQPVTTTAKSMSRPSVIPPELESDAVEHARKLLEDDRRRAKPWERILTAVEEVGLARIMRGTELQLSDDLPRKFRSRLKPTDERAKAFDALMLHNRKLVWRLAGKHVGTTKGLEFEDAEQSGYKGLHRAIEKFDASRGLKFSTYATWWINQAIQRAVADEGSLIRIPVHVHEKMVKALAARNKLLTENGVAPLSAIAANCGVTIDQALELLLLSAGVVSLDAPITDDGLTRADLVSQSLHFEGPIDPETHIVSADEGVMILEAIESLSAKEAAVVKLRFGFIDDDPNTLEEIGVKMGVTRERIRQIEKLAKEKLAQDLGRRGVRQVPPSS